MNFNTVWDTIQRIMIDPVPVESSFDLMIERLKENVDAQPYLQEVIQRLEKAEPHIKKMHTTSLNNLL